MHTEMHGSCLEKHYVEKSRLVWWTVYILERRMSSLLGVPLGISEESISAPFPSNSAQTDSSNTLEMQAKLCQILAKVDLSESPPFLFHLAWLNLGTKNSCIRRRRKIRYSLSQCHTVSSTRYRSRY